MQGTVAAGAARQGHPRGLYLLFFTEMWERMSYYGMRGLLVLFLTSQVNGGFGWSKSEALSLYGTYTGLVYLTPIVGGFIADRFMGQRRAVVLGGVLMMIGHLVLALPSVMMFYVGLGFLIIGNGFFKPNISTMVGGLYAPGDGRRDGAFTIFYMGINLGAMLGNFICGTLGEKVGWHWGFGSAGVGMFLGLIAFLSLQKKLLGDVGLAPVKPTPQTQVAQAGGEKKGFSRDEIDRIVVIFIIALFVVAFWAGFEQAGGLMNLYTNEKVDRHILFGEVPTTWFQNFNSFFIVALAPVFAGLWGWLAARGKDPSIPVKMGMGLVFLSIGFVFMLGASNQSADVGKAAAYWVILAYLFHTMGELCLSPVGLSMVTKVAPQRIVSAMMGVWFLANAAANKLSGVIGGYSEKLGEFDIFLYISIGTGIAGLILLVVSPVLKKMMHGTDEVKPASPTNEQAQGGSSVAAA
ncbi:proton-dependent oligopeptide transporter, POT family [Myxococcus fulvus]|uniref:MFS transporter n=1 Tax=Myxococcus fulvus TaxID=33 RepID=A0A511T3B7_MYXFU|nr:peptide MFS transporter [Myxococcus fulvus]AKF80898.1 DeoR family transcriptional regulator [Myxococcus fulvus 124B02]GEN08651.1 MFS transporter [Myxococcus fulvus]SEU30183.1 proton-dependent oligopeptide transporter, POT family [Myxococcus fulvus]